MATTTTAATTTEEQKKLASDEYINKMYDANLASQNETLKQNYMQGIADLDTEQASTRKQTDENLNRTYVESQKAARNYGEVQNAYGLTSGAMAQAKLAQDTTLQKDLTALRGIQQSADADIARQRTLLAQQYASAIAKAQADNDMQRAQALYEDAAKQEERLLQQQEAIANIFATKKDDYSYYQKLYNLTDEQMAQLTARKSSGGGSSRLPARFYPATGGNTGGTGGDSGSSSGSGSKGELNRGQGVKPSVSAVDKMWNRNS